jgi:erythromycin esterase-like protein
VNPGNVTKASVLGEIHSLARPLRTERDLDGLVRRAADCRFTAIGEASHGTHL